MHYVSNRRARANATCRESRLPQRPATRQRDSGFTWLLKNQLLKHGASQASLIGAGECGTNATEHSSAHELRSPRPSLARAWGFSRRGAARRSRTAHDTLAAKASDLVDDRTADVCDYDDFCRRQMSLRDVTHCRPAKANPPGWRLRRLWIQQPGCSSCVAEHV